MGNPDSLHMRRSMIYNNLEGGIRICPMNYFMQHTEISHFHDFYELVFVHDGSGTHSVNGKRCRIERGNVFLIRPGETHGYIDADNMRLMNCIYLPEKLSLPLKRLRSMNGYVYFFESQLTCNETMLKLTDDEFTDMDSIINQMYTEQERAGGGYEIFLNAKFIELTLLISRSLEEKISDIPNELMSLFLYCNEHLESGLNVESMAAHGMISVRTLERLLKKHLHTTPVAFLQKIRMTYALNQLSTSDKTITAVAHDSGFSNPVYFARAFKDVFGITPLEYRRGKYPDPPANVL
ncbi:MAG: helix-turn-helix domain-containing protein [Victivallaceae bacterium]|nr:helix-turn-helix domain-containing protein [Victivallaceae bacterium]